MSDFQPSDLIPTSGPNCPLCGGETFLTQMHKAVAAVDECVSLPRRATWNIRW